MITKFSLWKKHIRGNLRYEIISYLLICLVVGITSFLVLSSLSRLVITQYVEPAHNKRILQNEAKRFQTYIHENHLSSHDWEEISSWSERESHVYILRIDQDTVEEKPDKEENEKEEINSFQVMVPIQYSDMTANTNFLLVRTNSPQMVALFCIWLISFLLCIYLLYRFVKKKIQYLLEIEAGIYFLEGGSLDYKIPVQGEDELSRLALSINSMSKSFVEQIQSEEHAIQSSKETIRDLSHHIRTPLTILSSYVPLLLRSKPITKEQQEYLFLIQKRTEQLCKRIDESLDNSTLFSDQQQFEKEEILAAEFFEQLVRELNSLANVVAQNTILNDTKILGDSRLLTRLFDNLIANICQYGDLTRPVYIVGKVIHGQMSVEIENTIKIESTSSEKSVGLEIMQDIIEGHKGTIEVDRTDGTFKIVIKIPVLSVTG